MRHVQQALLSALVAAVAGCMTLRPVVAPAPFISERHPHLVYVVDRDSSVVAISQPRLEGDSVIGVLPGYGEPIGASLTEARQVLASQRDSKRTALFVAGVGIALGTVVYLATRPAGGSGCQPTGIYGQYVC